MNGIQKSINETKMHVIQVNENIPIKKNLNGTI